MPVSTRIGSVARMTIEFMWRIPCPGTGWTAGMTNVSAATLIGGKAAIGNPPPFPVTGDGLGLARLAWVAPDAGDAAALVALEDGDPVERLGLAAAVLDRREGDRGLVARDVHLARLELNPIEQPIDHVPPAADRCLAATRRRPDGIDLLPVIGECGQEGGAVAAVEALDVSVH